MKIPIRNLYYLFLYAWEYLPASDVTDVGIDSAPDLPNLFARVLLQRTKRLMRRGLDRGYMPFESELQGLRGRLLLEETLAQGSLLRGGAICQFDELQHDVLHNQILKATITRLSKDPKVETRTRHDLAVVARSLRRVSDIRLSGDVFSRLMIYRNNREYRLLMQLCDFVFQSSMPDSVGSGARFSDVLEDETAMSRVFESFLRNFLRHHALSCRVASERLDWDVTDASPESLALLPGMITDITLAGPDRVAVIDAKFYRNALDNGPYGRRLRSGHLYQLTTYLRHTAKKYGEDRSFSGMLVYPSNGATLRLRYVLGGMPVHVATVDLARSWQEIETEILDLLAMINVDS